MSGFAIRYPFFIIMLCLIVTVVGITTVARMPVDLFPDINIPVVVAVSYTHLDVYKRQGRDVGSSPAARRALGNCGSGW